MSLALVLETIATYERDNGHRPSQLTLKRPDYEALLEEVSAQWSHLSDLKVFEIDGVLVRLAEGTRPCGGRE